MENFEELVPEIYGVLMVLGIVMNEEESLNALKEAKFDEPTATFILQTAQEVQSLTQEHHKPLNEIIEQDHLKDSETKALVNAYLTEQGVAEELLEIIFLYHSFVLTIDFAEEVILEGEKQGWTTKEIKRNIKKLGGLDRETNEAIYITAMTRLGKEYEAESASARRGRKLIRVGIGFLIISLLEFIFIEDTSVLYTSLAVSALLIIAGFVMVTRAR